MTPAELRPILEKVLCIPFSDEPPYDAILKSLDQMFEKALQVEGSFIREKQFSFYWIEETNERDRKGNRVKAVSNRLKIKSIVNSQCPQNIDRESFKDSPK